MSRKVALALATVGLSAFAHAAQQAPAFVGRNQTVPVYATVTNIHGRIVPNLTQNDFAVFDNGKPQPLTAFRSDVQPITIVIMVDRSGSFLWPHDLIDSAVDQFLSELLPADRARVGGFSGRIEIAPGEFTGDHSELHRAFLEQGQDAGPTPLWNATAAALDALANREGRRALLILTDSKDSPDPTGVRTTLAAVTARAQSEDIAVYAVGLAGRVRSGGTGPRFQSRGGGGRGGGQSGPGARGSATGAPDPWMVATPDPGLKKLAGDSGGDYFELAPTDSFTSTFARIADELHYPYLLEFAAATRDGRMHALKVSVHAPDVTTEVRKAYLASSDR